MTDLLPSTAAPSSQALLALQRGVGDVAEPQPLSCSLSGLGRWSQGAQGVMLHIGGSWVHRICLQLQLSSATFCLPVSTVSSRIAGQLRENHQASLLRPIAASGSHWQRDLGSALACCRLCLQLLSWAAWKLHA